MPAAGLLLPLLQFFDDDGTPAAGWFLYTYQTGTSTPVATYTDADFEAANENPIELDAAGRCTVYLDPSLGALKLAMHDADDVLQWTVDPVFPTQTDES